MEQSVQHTQVKAKQHESYVTYTLIAFLIPLVGFILGIVYLTKDTKLDKKFGEHLLAISILFVILQTFAYFFLLPMVGLLSTPGISNYLY